MRLKLLGFFVFMRGFSLMWRMGLCMENLILVLGRSCEMSLWCFCCGVLGMLGFGCSSVIRRGRCWGLILIDGDVIIVLVNMMLVFFFCIFFFCVNLMVFDGNVVCIVVVVIGMYIRCFGFLLLLFSLIDMDKVVVSVLCVMFLEGKYMWCDGDFGLRWCRLMLIFFMVVLRRSGLEVGWMVLIFFVMLINLIVNWIFLMLCKIELKNFFEFDMVCMRFLLVVLGLFIFCIILLRKIFKFLLGVIFWGFCLYFL